MASPERSKPQVEEVFTDRTWQAQAARPGVLDQLGPKLGCRTFLSFISKGFGGFCSRLLRLRTVKRSSAFRWHGFTHIF